jgi:small subunit ribosomal protein S21
MARRSTVRRVEEFVLFDVLYQDGTRTSNRNVPSSELVDIEADLLAETYIEVQDRQNCRALGKTPAPDQVIDPLASPLGSPGRRTTCVSGKGSNPVQVYVRDNDVNAAIRVLKKKMQREGTFREMKRRRSYEKPSERRVRERAEAVRRYRKAMRKRLEREGY